MNDHTHPPPFDARDIAAITGLITPHVSVFAPPPLRPGRGGIDRITVPVLLPPMLTAVLNGTPWQGGDGVSRVTVARRFGHWCAARLWDRLANAGTNRGGDFAVITDSIRACAHERAAAADTTSRGWAVAALTRQRRTTHWREGPGAAVLAATQRLHSTR